MLKGTIKKQNWPVMECQHQTHARDNLRTGKWAAETPSFRAVSPLRYHFFYFLTYSLNLLNCRTITIIIRRFHVCYEFEWKYQSWRSYGRSRADLQRSVLVKECIIRTRKDRKEIELRTFSWIIRSRCRGFAGFADTMIQWFDKLWVLLGGLMQRVTTKGGIPMQISQSYLIKKMSMNNYHQLRTTLGRQNRLRL